MTQFRQPRKRGRPPANEDRSRMQFSVRSSVNREITEWHQSGALAPTLSGTVQYILESWLEANRNMLPLLIQANAVQQSLVRSQRHKAVRRALRTKTAAVILQRAQDFISIADVQEAIDQEN